MSCTRLVTFSLTALFASSQAAFADELPSPADLLDDWAAAWQTVDADK